MRRSDWVCFPVTMPDDSGNYHPGPLTRPDEFDECRIRLKGLKSVDSARIHDLMNRIQQAVDEWRALAGERKGSRFSLQFRRRQEATDFLRQAFVESANVEEFMQRVWRSGE